MNFKLHINMNLSPDFSCSEVTEISANWLNVLILLIKSEHLRRVGLVRWKRPKQLQRWCARTVVAGLGRDIAAALIDRCRRPASEFAQLDSDSEP